MRIETLLLALSTFFATIGPGDLILVYAALTEKSTPAERRQFALRGTLIATGILLFFAVFGEAMLRLFGITLPALRIAGGVLLLLISIDMVFARHSGGTGTTPDEENEARKRHDISVFPLATPLIAGPGAIATMILLVGQSGGGLAGTATVVGVMLAVIVTALVFLLLSPLLERALGRTGTMVITRLLGMLLAALSVQFVIDGVKGTGLIG